MAEACTAHTNRVEMLFFYIRLTRGGTNLEFSMEVGVHFAAIGTEVEANG